MKTLKRPFKEAMCTCTSARSLLYQSLVVHKPKCLQYAFLANELQVNVRLHDAVGFAAPVPTILEEMAERRSRLTPSESPLLA